MTAAPTRTFLDRPAIQIDALREVANIASGHAATALGQLTDRKVMISVPEFALARAEQMPQLLGYGKEPVIVVAMQILGDVTGGLVYLMPESQGRRLTHLLQPEHHSGLWDDIARSCIAETANIIGGAYSGALATLTGRIVMLSVPTFGIEPPDGVLASQHLSNEQLGLCIESTLMVEGEHEPFGGHILLLPHPAALQMILDALSVWW